MPPELSVAASVSLHDYEARAAAVLPPEIWDYVRGGSDDERTLLRNAAAFGELLLQPRVLVDVSRVDCSTTVLGTKVSLPVLLAPVGYQRLFHPEGELASAGGAEDAQSLLCVPTLATVSLEEVAAASKGPLWFQLYPFRDRTATEAIVRRAHLAGYRALVVTVDAPRLGNRERDRRNLFSLPRTLATPNLPPRADLLKQRWEMESALAVHAQETFDAAFNWESLAWLRGLSPLPLVLKGILCAEDAVLAVRHGCAGVVVSNHGGRQLDGVPAAVEVLPEVVAAVGGGVEVYLDGGVRRGTDVLKAVALGARAVLVGRPLVWGLATGGRAGVRQVLELLRDELLRALSLTGRTSLSDVRSDLVRHASSFRGAPPLRLDPTDP